MMVMVMTVMMVVMNEKQINVYEKQVMSPLTTLNLHRPNILLPTKPVNFFLDFKEQRILFTIHFLFFLSLLKPAGTLRAPTLRRAPPFGTCSFSLVGWLD